MAIRYRKDRKSPWCVYWTNPFTGKRESASYLDKETAEKENSLIKHRLRFEREYFQKEIEESEKATTLEAVFLAYLKQKQFSKNALRTQLVAMRIPLRLFGAKNVAGITRADLENAKAAIYALPIRGITKHSYASKLRAVMNWAAAQELCEPIRFPKMEAGECMHFVPPTPQELQTMLAVAPPHMQRVILIGAQCGVRIGQCELFGLTWHDVDLSRAVLRVHGAKKNKSMPWREVPIRSSLVPLFEEWQNQDLAKGIEHLIHFNGKPVERICNGWNALLKRAGIMRRIRPYDLRHAFATECIAAGVDIGTVAKLMGHSTPMMILKHYQHVMDKQKQAAVEALPDLYAAEKVPKPMCPKGRAGYIQQ